MKRKADTDCGVYRYLEMSGVLDTGTGEEIAEKRKEYWRERKRLWKQEKRRKETEFRIYLAEDELEVIGKAAKAQGMSRTRYLKDAALAYADKKFLVVNRESVNHIRQLLALNYSLLQDISETLPERVSDTLLRQMERLEEEVHGALLKPMEIPENPDAI